jgi:hypothetical protein
VSLGAVGAIAGPLLGVGVVLGGALAALAGALGVLALPSIPTRRVTILLLGVAGVGALRHAAIPSTDSTLIVVFAAGMLLALVLADRADGEAVPAMAGAPPLERRWGEAARASVAIGAIVAVTAVAVVPSITDELGRRLWNGALPTVQDMFSAPNSLHSSKQLDMTERPRLSDRVVFTVEAPRPDFWRGEVFDVWNGRHWTRSDESAVRLTGTGDAVQLVLDKDDPGAQFGTPVEQTFHVEASFSDVIFAAPSPVEVRATRPLFGRPDGTAGVAGGFGEDAVYTVTSRSTLATADDLRRADTARVPATVDARYAQPPQATDRVRALARSVTAGAPTTYDKVRAIERWLGAHTQYSLDAPLAPRGVDVVDHFLFESQLGWCEQVASSLVVIARSAGIPARLATGFVPGEHDGLSGRWIVRERDAHAWAEVYFPGVGWQGFDPTAKVPLAGEAPSGASWFEWAREHALAFGIGLLVLVWAFVSGPDAVQKWRRRLAARRSWAARTLGRLERVGRRAGRPRHPAETPREYARALAARVGDARLAGVGEAIDRDAFGSSARPDDPTVARRRAEAEAALATMPRYWRWRVLPSPGPSRGS